MKGRREQDGVTSLFTEGSKAKKLWPSTMTLNLCDKRISTVQYILPIVVTYSVFLVRQHPRVKNLLPPGITYGVLPESDAPKLPTGHLNNPKRALLHTMDSSRTILSSFQLATVELNEISRCCKIVYGCLTLINGHANSVRHSLGDPYQRS